MTASHASPTFCVLPWTHFFLGNTGKFYPCCLSEGEFNALKNEKGNDLSLNSIRSTQEVWSSPTLQEIRNYMLEGKWHPLCGPCKAQEYAGQKSYRQWQNEDFVSITDFNLFENLSTPNPGPLSLDLRLGNNCNLKCRMCNPETSRLWVDEWNLLHPEDLDDDEKKAYMNLKWHHSSHFKSLFYSLIPQLNKVNFGGGEPFFEEAVITFLQECIKSGHAKNIVLSFNTNLTILPQNLLTLFPLFKRVDLYVSLDAYGELNDYIRYPSKFFKIIENIEMILNRKSELNIGVIEVLTTIQMYNVFDFDKLLLYLAERFYPNVFWPKLNFVHDPDYLNIQVLTANLKKSLEDKFCKLLENPKLSSARPIVDSILNYMNQSDKSYLFEEFLSKSTILDKNRGQNFFKISSFPRPLLEGSL